LISLQDEIEAVSNIFPLDLDSTMLINNNIGEHASLYRVIPENSSSLSSSQIGETYIIDSLAGGEIACHPYLVGQALRKKCVEVALAFQKALQVLDLYSDLSILHILRGASGYIVPEVLPSETPLLSIRTEYHEDGYRSHSDDSRRLEVTFRNYPTKKISTLIMPDTYATGRSAETGINDLITHGLKPKRVILYGFIASPSLQRLGQLCQQHEIELISFGICSITPLAHNNYDMPIYGLDESYYTKTGKIRYLGCIIPSETLERLLPEYVAGMDQPGDWSERHHQLFNGNGNENGNMMGHLKKSQHLIQILDNLNSQQKWYTELHREIANRTLNKINDEMSNYL